MQAVHNHETSTVKPPLIVKLNELNVAISRYFSAFMVRMFDHAHTFYSSNARLILRRAGIHMRRSHKTNTDTDCCPRDCVQFHQPIRVFPIHGYGTHL